MKRQCSERGEMDKKKLKQAALYQVGYGKPPKNTQFVKGQSGNPGGRPKGAKNRSVIMKSRHLNQIFLDHMREPLDSALSSRFEAMLQTLSEKALGGDFRSLQYLIKTTNELDHMEQVQKQKILEKMSEYKFLTSEAVEKMRKHGMPTDHFLPHPDHIIVDLRQGEVFVRGPSNEREKKIWDELHKNIREKIDRIKTTCIEILKITDIKSIREMIKIVKIDLASLYQTAQDCENWDIIIPWDEVKGLLEQISERHQDI